jgi:hypothetical protein
MAMHPVTLSNDTDRSLANLSNGHKRGIETTLAILDEELCQFEEWAKGREIHSVLYHEQNTLSAEQRNALSSETAMMKEILVELRNTLKLACRIRTVEKVISSQCSTLWIYLRELESSYLLRYSEISPDLVTYFDPRISQLVDHINQIRKIVRTK